MNLVLEFRPDIASRPNKGLFDPEADKKIQKFGLYRPYDEIKDMIELLIHLVMVTFCLRGNKEPRNIKIGYFKWSKTANGLRKVTLDGNQTKCDRITLTNHTLNDGAEYHTIVEDPKNKHCVVKLLWFYKKMLPS